ncbi:DUF4112 domain-containing protein [Maricaulaceae bacterium MS644]
MSDASASEVSKAVMRTAGQGVVPAGAPAGTPVGPARSTPMPRDNASSDSALPRPLARARGWARLLDERFSIFGFRFGLDGVLGLIPGVGGLVTLAGGAVMVTSAHNLRLSNAVKARIVAYTVLDALIGSVPVVGDIADFLFKAHKKSLNTIEKALARQAESQRRDQGPGPEAKGGR